MWVRGGGTALISVIAVLQTGRTEFKEPRQFRRHVSTLAKYTAEHHLLVPWHVGCGRAGLVVVMIRLHCQGG